MKTVGVPVFAFSKDLVSQELVHMQVPLITTLEGNETMRETDVVQFEERELMAAGAVAEKFRRVLPQIVQQNTEATREYLVEHLGFEAWGDKFAGVFTQVSQERKITINGTSTMDAPHGPATWSRNLIDSMQLRGFETIYDFSADFLKPLLGTSSEALADRPEVATDEAWMTSFGIFVNTVFAYTQNESLPPERVTEGIRALFALASDPDSIEKLATLQAEKAFQFIAQHNRFDELAFNYPAMVFDQIDSSHRPRNPHFKLARWIAYLQKKAPVIEGINITYGEVTPLAAIRDKLDYGTPLVHVDHVLAKGSSLIRHLETRYTTEAEQQWLKALSAFERQAVLENLDKYIALWPENVNIAQDRGIPPERIHYIPNAVRL
jgi:hypothetical protein